MTRAALVVLGLSVWACAGSPPDQTQPIHVEAPDEDPTARPVPPPEDETPPPPDDDESPDPGDAPELAVSDVPCESDADCVPGGCCHAAACVARADAPACQDMRCTADCQVGTMDCGGGCVCHEGRCAARLMQPPRLAPAPP